LDPRSTQDLLRLYDEGEKEAVGLLLDRYYDRVCAVVHRCLPAAMRPRYDTGDVVQEAMIRVFRKLDAFEYKNEGAFFSWICTATERVLIDLIRHSTRQRRDSGKEVSLDATHAPQPAAPADDPGERVLEQDEVLRVMEGLDRLPEAQRRAILYREYGRLSWKELGEAIGVSYVTARRRYMEAVAALSRILSQ
jgi:RNA polymerase sigma-70 factor (ECF subfamily)